MCCQAEDYLTALQFLYNGFIRALAAKDLMRCLRWEVIWAALVSWELMCELFEKDRYLVPEYCSACYQRVRGQREHIWDSFIRVFCFDFCSFRFEQQALHLVDKVKSLGSKPVQVATDDGELDAKQQVSTQHVEFLVNMSRATRRRDWAWFEIAETEMQKLYVSQCILLCLRSLVIIGIIRFKQFVIS